MSKISKSSIDWKKMLELVPPEQKVAYFVFKAKNELYTRRMLSFPAEAPKIDWEQYKKEVPTPGLVDKLKSAYESFKVPYPEDKYSAEVDKQWNDLQPEIKKYCDEMKGHIETSNKELTRIRALPKFDDMTIEMYYNMFPEDAIDFVGKPSFWPHSPDEQMGWKDPTVKAEH